jgi:amino acid transporter/nucleotide-binding universal stress UspA family protein
MAAQQRQGELERTLGLPEALAIGVGTMVGAGIFVFPGIAAGEAGPAALLSFLLGAGIALLVALPASELATAMPQSGGGYYFVSRGLGTLAGCAVGVGQWVGLMFASAFYLVGFGHYLNDLLGEIGFGVTVSIKTLAVTTSVLLTVVGLTGAEKTGELQNNLVGVLVSVLVLFLGYGVLDALGLFGTASAPEEFMPFGASPIFTTAALVFTSYLGFAQIATVAGDIQDPGRNLPRAMVGSVLLVGLLYALMIFVCTSVASSQQLEAFGETAAVEVARRLLGTVGALAIMGCGLLATLSSANASIMSASRAVYALSKDDLFPERAAVVNRRFGTPHVSLLLAGIPTAGLILAGRTEVLAEVASFLHLVMYGLICFALVVLRRQDPTWYAPVFRSPGYPVLPLLGGVASFALIGFMEPLSMGLGAAVLVGALGWYAVYARDVTIQLGEREEIPSLSPLTEAQVLVPVLLPDPDPPPEPLRDLLGRLDVIVLGVYEVPRQTAPEQARDQFGEEARHTLDAWVEPLTGQRGALETRLVFSPTPMDTIERVAAEERSDAILVPGPVGHEHIEHILVPVRSDVNTERISAFVAALTRHSGADVTILHVMEDGDTEGDVLEPYQQQLRAQDVPADRVGTRAVEAEQPVDAIVDAADENDLIVLGESKPSVVEKILGTVPRRIAQDAGRPVLVVRYPDAEREADEEA